MISEDMIIELIKGYLPQISEQRLKLLSRAVVQETELAVYTITRQVVASEREHERSLLLSKCPPATSA